MDDTVAGRDIERRNLPFLDLARAATPARILTGRVGGSYRTSTLLELRRDHAAARDAVNAELELATGLGPEFVARWGLFEVGTNARSKLEFLLRPDLGRTLDEAGKADIKRLCPAGADIQVAIGDGLSAAAVIVQVSALLPLLHSEATARGWRFGQPVFIRHCRVGVLNDLGELLDPAVVILLIGERPGLATATSLSAYMAYRPRYGHDDACRNLISNIHDRGVPPAPAAERIALLAEQMMRLGKSGYTIKEASPAIQNGSSESFMERRIENR